MGLDSGMTSLVALALLAQQPPVFSQASVSGIVVTEFETPQGRIHVYLPDDMAAGDTISGMVYTEPKGTGAAREANAKLIQGLVVSVDGRVAERDGPRITVRALDRGFKLSRSLDVKLSESTYSAPVEVDSLRADRDLKFMFPDVAPSGRPMLIAGPFDGDNGTTSVSVGGKAATVLVESPRSCVVQQDASFVGRKTVSVADGGRAGEGSVVLPKIVLTAAKTSLVRGEKTQITVTVQGLEGAPDSVFPIPLELKNESPNVISMPRYVNWSVEPTAVSDGTWTRTLEVTSVNPGSFVVTGALFMVKLHDAKSAMTPEEFNEWLLGLRALYEEKLKALQKEADAEAARNGGRVNDGLSSNIGRKKKMLQTIEAFSGISTEGEKQAAAIAIDKVLADEAFFSLAADLISVAADMLGYTEIPLPGVGALIKGAKAVAKKLPKVVKALEKAEKLHEELEKAKDAKEKLDKAAELKKALGDAKAVMEGEK